MQLNQISGYSLYRRLNLFLILTMALILGACASGVKLDDIDGPSKKAAAGSAPATSQPNPFANQPWNDPKNPLFNKSFTLNLRAMLSKQVIKLP
jgi:peptidoglycan-associated lipoprotein